MALDSLLSQAPLRELKIPEPQSVPQLSPIEKIEQNDSQIKKMLMDAAAQDKAASGIGKGAIAGNINKMESIANTMGYDPKKVPLPRLQETPLPPREELDEPANVFKNAAPVMAIFAGLLSRRPLIASMNAMGAAMKGYHEGDVEKYNRHRQIWEDTTKQAIEHNKNELEQYHAVLDNAKLSNEEKLSQINAYAHVNQNEHLMAAGAGNNLAKAVEIIKTLDSTHKTMVDSYKVLNQGAAGGGMTDEFRNDSTNQALADGLASGVPVSSLIRGRGKDAEERLINLQRLAKERHPDWSPASSMTGFIEEQAESRTVGANSGRIKLAANSLSRMIPVAQKAMKGVDLGNYPSINAIENAVAKGTGDPNIVKLNTALQAVISDHAALMVRGGQPTVESRNAAREMVNQNLSAGQLEGYFDIVEQEKEAQMNAIEDTKNPTKNNSLPKVGHIEDGYQYIGGPYNVPSSWEKVQ
jgi:hypothetical protein